MHVMGSWQKPSWEGTHMLTVRRSVDTIFLKGNLAAQIKTH